MSPNRIRQIYLPSEGEKKFAERHTYGTFYTDEVFEAIPYIVLYEKIRSL